MDATSAVDWRSQLQPEDRQRIVNKIMETLKRHLPISIPEGLNELRKIAIQFEEKIYTDATSQSDYLRRIQMKMLSMETKTQPSAPINPTNAGVNQNPPDSGSPGIQSQINNPGQPRQIRQQSLPSNSSAAMQGSSGLALALTSMSGLALSNISGVTQASNLQNMPGIPQTSVNNAIGQGVPVHDLSIGASLNRPYKRQSVTANGSITDCESCSTAQDDSSIKKQKVSEPKEPTFSCPICMHTIVSLWSTICGHVFCEDCIKLAIQKQKKCPTCRTGLAMKNGIHRVFLPTAD